MRLLLAGILLITCLNIAIKFTTNAAVVKDLGPCITPDAKDGKCVFLQDCSFHYELLKNGVMTKDEVQYLRRSQCGNDFKQVYICCTDAQMNFKRETQETKETQVMTTTEVPSATKKPEQQEKTLLQAPTCGKFHESWTLDSRGQRGAHPWNALLMYRHEKYHYTRVACSGVLISAEYVLTSADCIGKERDGWSLNAVRLGDDNQDLTSDCYELHANYLFCLDPYVDIGIRSHIVHPEYNETSLGGNIAILKLQQPLLKFTEYIRPVCLFNMSESIKNGRVNALKVETAGWFSDENFIYEPLKRSSTLQIWNDAECTQLHHERKFLLFCADGFSYHNFVNDFGSPLLLEVYVRNEVVHYLIGILVQKGNFKGANGAPNLYTNILFYLDWIVSNIQ